MTCSCIGGGVQPPKDISFFGRYETCRVNCAAMGYYPPLQSTGYNNAFTGAAICRRPFYSPGCNQSSHPYKEDIKCCVWLDSDIKPLSLIAGNNRAYHFPLCPGVLNCRIRTTGLAYHISDDHIASIHHPSVACRYRPLVMQAHQLLRHKHIIIQCVILRLVGIHFVC